MSITPQWLVERLERSAAEAAAGQSVLLEPVLDELRPSIARMKVKRKPAPEGDSL